jgi:multidrug efflux pump subunit AcrB
MVCGTELGVVALIGIILLIGIVQKNAIMMIDFALDGTQRKRNRRTKRFIRRACCASGRS